MKDIELIVNGKLEVMVEDHFFKTVIQDITDSYLAIAIPIKGGQYYVPQRGEFIEAFYYEDKQVYKFESYVTGRRTDNNVPQILLSIPQKFEEVQRRQFVRVPVAYYIQYEKVAEEKLSQEVETKLDKNAAHKGIMLDISGGGFRLKADSTLKLGDKIVADIPSEDSFIRVRGQIVRVETNEDNNHICGVNFLDLDNRAREKIIKYIFAIMRKQRKTL